jgi:hypothetical protein
MKIVAVLNRSCDVVLGMACEDCGTVHELQVLTAQETRDLIGQLQELLDIGARIHALPVPYITDPERRDD